MNRGTTSLVCIFSLTAWASVNAQVSEFGVEEVLEVGRAPHQISFSPDGSTAYIAAAGSNHLAVVDVETYELTSRIRANQTPLGVASTEPGFIVSRFGANTLGLLSSTGEVIQELHLGGRPSLLVGPLPQERYLVSVEKEDVLRLVNVEPFRVEASYPTGGRPFPASSTSDGRLAFVPNYDDGTVTVIDLWNERVRDVVPVGEKPSGGTVLPRRDYAVAVRGENRLVFLNTASFQITGSIEDGIGDGPFSVVATADGRFAFVNNTESHDVSVVDLTTRRVIERIAVGAKPIAMSVHPNGKSLWVASEGSHTVSIINIPASRQTESGATSPNDKTEVAVLGMTHGTHRDSTTWGLAQVRETVRRFQPDVVCVEIPPNRFDAAWKSFEKTGAIAESRAVRFPEYTDVIFALALEMDFEIVPCAGWTQEMSDLRRTRLAVFNTSPEWAATKRTYDAKIAAVESRRPDEATMDDPRFIHSPAYDEVMRERYEFYDETLNDWIGPGGWTNINRAHYANVEKTIRQHLGKRILVTFGGAHKYWLQDALRKQPGVELMDVTPFLPPVESGDPMSQTADDDLDSRAREEVFELHQFFEDWFGGAIPQDSLSRFQNVLADDFEIISPEGQKSSRDQIVGLLESAHGVHRERGVRIWIENFRSRELDNGGRLATYEEWQRIGGATRARLSSVVFTRETGTPNGIAWRHVHETWLPTSR